MATGSFSHQKKVKINHSLACVAAPPRGAGCLLGSAYFTSDDNNGVVIEGVLSGAVEDGGTGKGRGGCHDD